MIPKTAAEILAAARPPPPKPPRKKPKSAVEVTVPVNEQPGSSNSATRSAPSVTSQSKPATHAKTTTSTSVGKGLDVRKQTKESIVSHSGVPMTDNPEVIPEAPQDRGQLSFEARINEVLDLLRGGRLSPFDLVLEILDEENSQYWAYRNEFYKDSSQKMFMILERFSAGLGRQKIRSWMRKPKALELICEIIGEEMDAVKKVEQLPGLAAITPQYIQSWKVSGHEELAPALMKILLSAAETSSAKEKNEVKSPQAICNIIVKQLSYQRSHHSSGFAAQFGLFLWTCGCSRQTIEALHRCGLCVSYKSIRNMLESLAKHCVDLAATVGSGVHVFCYDNINLSTSIFVEQRGNSGPAKVTSGTFGILYKVRNGNPEHMKLAPILERFRKVKGLNFAKDVRPTTSQSSSVHFQLQIVVIRALSTYCNGFEGYKEHPALQHRPRRPMPAGYKTEQYPLRVSTIEEASVDGNLQFHEEIYHEQLKRSSDDLSQFAIPTYNDQLTNSRIRSGQLKRCRDLNAWTRREVFQLGFGLFHLCLNLVWAVLHVHRGSLGQLGSLTYFFSIMNKARLGGEHPDYYTLLAALTQILDGLLLNAWRRECGFTDLNEFSEKKPTADDLLRISEKIIRDYATPLQKPPGSLDTQSLAAENSDSDSDASLPERPMQASTSKTKAATAERPSGPDPDKDKAHQNLRLLTRDLLYVAELVRAISDGDIGRVEDSLPHLVMMFRGAGSNNYCTEILHFILNLKYVWTPEFANIMRDNMLVNLSGLPGHAMPIDLNIEHIIGQLKSLLSAKGLEYTWDRLGNISAAIDYLNQVKKQVALVMNLPHQNKNHSNADTKQLSWLIANTVQEHDLQVFKENRDGNSNIELTLDIHLVGEMKLKSSSLATFNRKIISMAEGRVFTEEVDTLPSVAFRVSGEADDDIQND